MDNSMDRYLGQLLDNRYEIQEIIGSGGMAVVYKALCHRLNRFVAVKILKDEFAEDEEFRERFRAESQAVAMLSHPNIVAVYDYSRDPRCQYIVMELLEGITLKQYMQSKGGALSWQEALHFSLQIAAALSHAHSKGIVHRDIKPQNIMVQQDGAVKVMDFGIAHLLSENEAEVHETVGSIHYISPEQARGESVDARADIYSLGVVMYEMLTGRLPYDGDTVESIVVQHMSGNFVLPCSVNLDIPVRLEEIVLRAMSAELEKRYQSVDELIADLEAFKTSQAGSDYVAAGTANGGEIVVQGGRKPSRAEKKISKKQYKANRKRARKVSTFSGIALIVIFLLAVVAFLYNYWLKDIFADDQRVVIPNFVGEDIADLQDSSAYEIYNFRVTLAIDPNVAEGKVISQDPVAGRSISLTTDGIDITLTVSGGVTTVEVPDVVNHDSRAAVQTLKNAGFQVETSTEASDTITEDFVIRTSPAAGEQAASGSTVIITVSTGAKDGDIVMTNLVGKTLTEAQAEITAAGLTMGTVTEVDSSYAKGTVIWQNIAEGEKVTDGTVIYLRVSTGNVTNTQAPASPTPSVEPTAAPTPETTVAPEPESPTDPGTGGTNEG